VLPVVINVAEDQSAEENAGADEENRKGRTGIDGTPLRFGFRLSEKIYADHD
jgi:hypothetical protein